MRMTRDELVRMLHSMGDNRTAVAVEQRLPVEIDTDRDADALAAAGLPHDRLLAKLAAGGMPRIIG